MAAVSVSFSSQPANPEQWGRQIQVRLQSQEPAVLRLGIARFHVSSRSGVAREYVMIPTAAVWRRGCTVAVNAAEPQDTIMLMLESEAAAMSVQEQLQSIVTAVVHSLHLRAEPTRAPLALKPIKRRQTPGGRGPFCLGGYVICSSTDMRRFSLHWAELYGPSPNGVVGFYFFAGHDPDAAYSDFTALTGPDCIQVKDIRMQVSSGSLPRGGARHAHEIAGDEYIIFRSPEEAQLWADMATAALDPCGRTQREDPLRNAARRADAVASGLRRKATKVRAPLLVEDTRQRLSRPGGAPMDAVAMHAREQQANRLHELARAAFDDWGDDSLLERNSPNGTTNYNFGTTNYNTTNYNTTNYH